MSILQELLQIANQLSKYEDYNPPELDALEQAANSIGKSWSGSWLGYQSRVYYADFQLPPHGAVFLQDRVHIAARGGNWKEYDFHEVVQFIHQKAGNSSTDLPAIYSKEAIEAFEQAKVSALSLVHANYDVASNKFTASLVAKIESLEISTGSGFIESQKPSGQMSSDTRALGEGFRNPPHIVVLSQVYDAKALFQSCKDLKRQIVSLAKYIQYLEQSTMQENKAGTNIFIGHGHSADWLKLKDFISDRLGLPCDEFNRVSPAGLPNTTRLSQMLDQACMAFLVMTAEDEQADSTLHARLNVIHEVGLFQGKLGFERAIILLEDGCEEFSNIHGLGQIRFPKGNISAIFEEVRQVLEREGII